ncbi:uncharacterized protein LOC144655584 isoform X1 [Oculina patagonica]
MLTDLDKLYIAMAEVGADRYFNTVCYGLNITSLDALQDYNFKGSTFSDAAEMDIIKERLGHKYLNFEDLAKKYVYKQSKLVETCKIKDIPIIQKKDIVVTSIELWGPHAGYVCEAQWTKPDGSKEKVCLRYEVAGVKENEFLHEAEMANLLRHENILAFHGVVIASSYSPSLALVVEFAEYGNLVESFAYHSVERLCEFTIQVATALEYLESMKVIHQSVKTFNCLVTADFKLKLAGIGACRFESDIRMEKQVPSVLQKDLVYMFAKLFSSAFASYFRNSKDSLKIMKTAKPQDVVYGYLCPSHFCDVFNRCLQTDPDERPSFSDVRRSLIAQEQPLKVRVTSSFNAESKGFLSCEAGDLITLISKDRHRGDKNAWLGETKDRKIGFFNSEHVEEVLEENVDDSVIPPEIRARGPKAELAFQNALRNGKVKVYRGRIMFLGQARAGKTSLKKSLLGIPFNPEEESTVGVEVDPSKCEVHVDQVSNWQRTEQRKLDVSEFADDIARIIAKDLTETGVDQKDVDDVDFGVEEGNGDEVDAGGPKELEDSPDIAKPIQETEQENEASAGDPSTIELERSKPADPDIQLGIDTTAALPNDVTDLVVQYLQNLKLEESIKTKEAILTLWDFAGQHLYYASHSVFLSPRAIYALVYNLSKDLNAPAEPCVRQGIHDIVLENPNNETNLESLLTWLASLHSIRPITDEAVSDQEGKLAYLRPPVFIVGTNADKHFEDVKKMEKCIQKSISGKTYEKHVIRPLFAVDNTRSFGDEGVQSLQKRVMEVLKQEPYMGEEVPIRWFTFEKVVDALIAKETYHMNLDQLLVVTRQVCRIDEKEELNAMLNFYHDLGVIVKHGHTVVLQAQWLIDLFKQLITVRPFDEVNPLYSECWLELEKSGILRMTLVDHVFADYIQKGLSKEDVLDMMELYGLIAKFSFVPAVGEQEQRYFVPAQLRSSPSGLCEITPSNSDPCPLYLHFLDGFVPHGLFPQLLSRSILWCSERGPKQAPNLYHNGARLFIGKQTIYNLILICRKRFIKIILKERRPSSAPPVTASSEMGRDVRLFLEDTLLDLSQELSWLCNLRYELCVACTSCLKEECIKHGEVCCAHDDCLHLLRVLPEEQLICPKSFSDDTVEVLGLEKWFQGHKTKINEEQRVAFLAPEALDQALSSKTGTPSTDDLLLLAFELGTSWKMLGRTLALPEPVLEQIEVDNSYLSERCYGVLRRWTEVFGSAATYESLARALQHPIVGRAELAVKYCDVCGDPYQVLDVDTAPIPSKTADVCGSSCPVFLSYQWDLQDTVKRLKSRMEESGIQCWMDIGQMGGGDALFAKIDAGIRACKVFVCCVTEKYCQSDACQGEATLAHSLKKPVIPLLFEDISWPPEGQLALIFTKLLYIKMTEKYGTIPDAEFQQLMRKVEEFVKP